LLESELFGYEKGAFTDARARKLGMFEQAQEGTLFLDEIGELELGLQAKLLRVLEEGAFRRVGGPRDIPLDVRVIAASNRDLKAESEARRFRLDLYYRLSVVQIDLPPLRERGDDVLALAEHLIAHFNRQMGKRVRGLAPEVAEIFRRYWWPGNVRELRNVVERAMILEECDLITTAYLPHGVAPSEKRGIGAPLLPRHVGGVNKAQEEDLDIIFGLPSGGIKLDAVELSLVEQAVARTGGNRTRAAELLGISRDRLRYRLKKLTADH
jgi:transcriptional regulator with PAS, ATPase and Fis domain